MQQPGGFFALLLERGCVRLTPNLPQDRVAAVAEATAELPDRSAARRIVLHLDACQKVTVDREWRASLPLSIRLFLEPRRDVHDAVFVVRYTDDELELWSPTFRDELLNHYVLEAERA